MPLLDRDDSVLRARSRRPPAGGAPHGVVALIAPALLAALVIYETARGGDGGLVVDARLAGLAAAGVALVARLPLVAVIAVAAATAAAIRLVG